MSNNELRGEDMADRQLMTRKKCFNKKIGEKLFIADLGVKM